MTIKKLGIRLSALALAAAPMNTAQAGGIVGLAHQSAPYAVTKWIGQGRPALAPFSYIQFCVNNPDDCRSSTPAVLKWTKENREMVAETNRRVNRSIRPKREAKDVWQADAASGDCEDFALTKRRKLLAQGVPSSALRLAVAHTPSGEGHAVLLVSTNDGDIVLDNRNNSLRSWRKTDLTWEKIASRENPRIWHSVF
ncbi:transglutaminase-like cysteine peptidase [Aureimonas sp. SA4125]|uniref:transglutaminase-like cysteine peptidase n=1 Tax=Aureimonas sp. SA4125 TaxID=2826993 RepID=UPI001CC6BF71|nr:transglutaminase-like cysteine peptidase [Aureimonas sp. SA4125]